MDGSEARARLFRDDGSAGGEYLFDWSRSGVGALPERPDNTQLTWFRRRLGSLLVVRPNPMLIGGETREEVTRPDPRLGNFASWYRWLSQEQPGAVMALNTALREVLPGFDVLRRASPARPSSWRRRCRDRTADGWPGALATSPMASGP